MKYFKPELLARCRSRDDDVADAAAKEWDEAADAYQARFKAIESLLPGEVTRLCSRFSLHDAKMLGAAFATREGALFGILLQLEGVPGHLGEILQLNYHPVAGPHGGVNVKPPDSSSGVRRDVWVLYDEFDLDKEHGFFTHSLLLSDGREIEVRFHGLVLRLLDQVVTPTHLPAGERKWGTAEAVG